MWYNKWGYLKKKKKKNKWFYTNQYNVAAAFAVKI